MGHNDAVGEVAQKVLAFDAGIHQQVLALTRGGGQ
jgi:hypothetical protein